MNTTRLQIIKSIGALILICIVGSVSAQAINTEFGKNRVQYHDDFKSWWTYETENFITYWYGKGRNVAQSVIQMSEMDHDEIQNVMEHRFNEKIEIIVYLDLTDLKQSNSGLDDTFVNLPKETKTEGNKMFVYFNGDHKQLRKQIRQGIASIYLSSILFGSNLQEIVQNAVLLSLPEWYQKGLIAYVGSYWDIDADDELRDLLNSEKKDYYDFEKLAQDFPRIAGHSLWYFLDQNYGKSSISNILYLTKINKNLKSSFVYVLGQEYEQLIEDWEDFYSAKYKKEENQFNDEAESPLVLKNKSHQPISQMRLSPDGRYLAYVINEIGKYQVVVRDFSDDSEKTILSKGFKNVIQETDYNYPLLAWHPTINEITILYEDRDVLKTKRIFLGDMTIEDQILPTKIQRVYSLSYFDNTDFIMAASDNGFSDLILYKSKTRAFDKLTDDYHDDLDATVTSINGSRGILFSSTRPGNLIEKERLDTIMPLENFDIFFLPFGKSLANRLTFTPDENERFPFPLGSQHISFINDPTGIRNRFIKEVASEDNGIINSNLSRNIIRHHSTKDQNLSLVHLYKDGAYQTFITYVDTDNSVEAFITPYKKEQKSAAIIPFKMEEKKIKDALKDEYLFVSEFEDPKELEPISKPIENESGSLQNIFDPLASSSKVIRFNSARAVASRKRFKITDLSSKLSNEFFYEGLESYEGELEIMQPMGILFKGTVKDLFEDYVINAGARFPTSFNGSEYFVEFENNKYRIDKKYVLYRKSTTESVEINSFPIPRAKNTSLMGLVEYSYPFNIYRRVSLTTRLRNDRYTNSSTERMTLELPIVDEKRLSLRLEYVYDNTLDIDVNVKSGTRYKIYSEASNKFLLDFVDGFQFDATTGFTTVLGADYRRYFTFNKYSVLAFRAAGATSFGSEKMIYFLGGVENEFFGEFNNVTPLPSGDNFAFKARAPHLRGFDQNIRNGSSFALINTEIRIPVIRHLFPNVSNSFFRNFQIAAFGDLGTAWHGSSPFSDENPLNTVFIEAPPTVKVFVNYFRDPLVLGYGLGVRTSVFGYYMKLDFAYGVETRTVLRPQFHFSFGNDF